MMPEHLKMLNDLRVELVKRHYDAQVINILTQTYQKWTDEEERKRKGGTK